MNVKGMTPRSMSFRAESRNLYTLPDKYKDCSAELN